ncbi:bacterial-like globin family protein [Asticcacaulis biprosthecium C19]|uniref:Bacterial-like globin family protein n=1 Tax=Asticcacaulis biprosthecium C19 TaxID=715226 RepID=F4QLX8_9CAUL|nr:group 1 truncated hemoglobin [Asticcacaulis biprosthecium]EGF92397.1 bacterial-like globin family protein [Asticcacaulis biprosthecium C19]
MKIAIIATALFAIAAPAFAAETVKDSAAVAPVIAADDSLYREFGGHDGLVKLVDDFMVILLDDPRTSVFFVDAKQDHIKKMLVEQFCVVLNGGCTYTGKGMKESHAQLGIDRASFNALVEDLQKAMDKNDIPFHAQNKLLAALAPQHRDIVTN